MTIGETVALATLLLGILGSGSGCVFWFATRDAQLGAVISLCGELKEAMSELTDAVAQASQEMRGLQGKTELFQQHVGEQHQAIWSELGRLRDQTEVG